MLALLVVGLAMSPVAFIGQTEAGAQVDTTGTTPPTTAPPPTTSTTRPTTPTTRPTATTRPTTTTTTTTTLPPTTTTVATTTTTVVEPTTTTRRPPPSTTTLIVTTTTGFVPPPPDPGSSAGGGDSGLSGLPPWSLPFVGAGAMLAAIVVATGLVRFATRGIPAIGRGLGSIAYKTSSGWAQLTTRGQVPPTQFAGVKPTLGARIGGFFLALTIPFRRLWRGLSSRDSSARRLRIHRQNTVGGLWDRVVLRTRMTRARFGRTRSRVDGHKRYWWLRFRRYIPWLR